MKSIDDIIIDKLTKGKGLNIKSIDTMITDKVSSVSAKGWESLKSTISGKSKKDEQKEDKKEKKEDQQNKKVVGELALSNDILVDISENTQLLHKAFEDLAKEMRQTIKTNNGGNANARASSAKGVLPTKDNRKGFDEKDKIQRAIVGEKNPLIPVVLSIKGDTKRIVELLEKGAFGKDKKDNGFDWKSLLPLLPFLGGALAGLLAPELASIGRSVITGIKAMSTVAEALLKNGDTLVKAGATIAETAAKNADTVAKAGATAAETVAKNGDTVAKAGASAVDAAATAAKIGAKATETAKDVNKPNTTLGQKAKNAVIGEQKVGKLGAVGVGLGIGGTIRRASDGDTNGAIAEGISTALPVILAKTKFGKLANLASLAIDGGLVARDLTTTPEERAGKDKPKDKDKKAEDEQVKKDEESSGSGGGSLSKIASNTAETNTILRAILGGGGLGGGTGQGGGANGGGGLLPDQLPPPEQTGNSTAGLLAGAGVLGVAGAVLAKKTGGLSNLIAKKAAPSVAKTTGIIKPNTALTHVADGAKKPLLATAPKGLASTGAKAGAKKAGVGATAKIVGKGAGKAVGKLIPGVGLVMGAMGAYDKASQGDYTGALIEGASGVASLIPGLGTVVSAGLTGLSVARDVQKETGDTGAAVGSGVGATALMGGALLASRGVGKLLTKAPNAIAGSAGKISGTVDKSGKSIADNAIASGRTIGSSVKDMQGKLSNTGKILTNTGTALKTNVEKMFTNVNGQLLKNIAKLGTIGALGAGVASMSGSGSSVGMIGTLGSVSSKYESGGRGVGTVSTGKGDHGGVSYGKHQMTAGTMTSFLKSKQGSQWAGHFKGLKAGTKEFSDKYKQVAAANGGQFEASQKSYIDANYFGVASNGIKSKTGLDVVSRGRAVQELVYSTAIQYGPQKCISMFASVLGKNAAKMSDADIINKIQDYKAKNVNTHFKSSSADVKAGISKRIANEKNDLMAMNNTAGTRTVGANQQTGSVTASGAKSGASTGTGAKSSGGTANNSSDSKGASADYDLDKICATAVSRAQKSSTKDCAKFVRIALQAGDNKKQIKGGLGHAYEWNKNLPKIGFVAVGQASPQKGDVAHLPPNKFSKIGHVCIWTGSAWVSDFTQKKLSPYSEEVPYTIYRAKSGYSNGSSVSAGEGVDMADSADGGVDGGSEGKQDDSTDGIISKAGDILANGVADIFNSDAMESVRKFIKGDIYKKGDDTPLAQAMGEFSQDVDEYDEARKLKGAGNNGERDDLSGVLGTDTEILRQQRSDNYDSVYGAMAGSNDIGRQQRPDDYNKVKNAIGGTTNIQRQLGSGGKKSKWWHSLFDGAFGGNNLLSGIFGLATGQRKLSDLTPDEIAGMVNGGFGEGGLFNGGGKSAIGKALGLDASEQLGQIANGGFGGGINGGSLVATYTSNQSGLGGALGQIANLALGDKIGSGGADILNKGIGSIFGKGTATDKANGIVGLLSGSLQNESIGTALGEKLGIGGGMANMVMSGVGGLIGGLKFVPKKEDVKIADSSVNFDPTEANMEESQMQMAKYYKEEADAKKFDVNVNVPQPVKTPTTSNPRGKSTQDGLGGAISVKNPDTIIHTVAVTMMSNSV